MCVVLHRTRCHLHERLFEGGLLARQFVQHYSVLGGQFAERLDLAVVDFDGAVAGLEVGDVGPLKRVEEAFPLR